MTKKKMDAVFELREAAEELGRQEQKLEADQSPERRDAVLDARLEVEGKTAEAIDACEDCGREHCEDESHAARRRVAVTRSDGKVVKVEFGKKQTAEVRAESESGEQ